MLLKFIAKYSKILTMNVIYLKNFDEVNEVPKLSLVLGNFDGVHIGHAQLINYARQNSSGNLGILTFDKTLRTIEGCLTSLDDRLEIFNRLNVDYVFVIKTDDNFKQMSYIKFVDFVLKKLNPIKIFCGPDFKYGFNAQGDVYYLKERFDQVYVLNYVNDHYGNKISSSSIRELIKNGDIYEANRWLGRIYKVKGVVSKGKGKGMSFGFPTANLTLLDPYIIPKEGVYVTLTNINNKKFRSITNVGKNPTIGDNNKLTIETYIFDFQDELYGKEISVSFYHRLRDEIKFSSTKKLIEQLEKDIDDAIYYFDYVKNIH